MKLFCCVAAILVMTGSSVSVKDSNSAGPAPRSSQTQTVPLSEIDLSRTGPIAPKGRVQDKEYNQMPVVDQLLAHGKEAIPFLISKLDDGTKIEDPVMSYWYQIYVGDVALIFLNDLFMDSKWQESAIEGMGWSDFLERRGNKELTSEQVLRNYIHKHGRKRIKERWSQVWEKYKERIYWDNYERSFKIS